MESRRNTVPAGERDQSAAAAFVDPGVTIDEGAILEARVIVLKDVKPWMIVMENTSRD
jgi:putative colanic acid biosynthesis acetyltransferase WcaF